MPMFSRLVPALVIAYGFQALAGAFFVPLQTEKYYDLCGSLGFLSTTVVSLYGPYISEAFHNVAWKNGVLQGLQVGLDRLPSLSTFAPRQLLLSAAIGLWSARLGYFLFRRALAHGGDSRFDQIKYQPGRFSFFWFMQATWVTIVGLPVYLANAIPPSAHPKLGLVDYASAGLFIASFALEAWADHQKSAWRKARDEGKHDEKFITSGLWSVSRHPNYVGDVLLHTSIFGLASTSLLIPSVPRGLIFAGAISPIFTYYLLRNLSGVPPLERNAIKKWADDPKWQHYSKTVPVFWPWGSTR